ncbi:hypothetical protein BBK14_02020 [Parafrankia soli]|uniref:HTH cro/C1-type domain-containing protein n=1 Tax=Parafrankia soli TaxID=2599596 RepID=A0A1S1RKR4_9ACTN|nr:helix-turn-helix transcriptional regulator [Parafrankia soli]OHV46647.1 hypothetical protein BBK14_02020 [Parafrankia soli]
MGAHLGDMATDALAIDGAELRRRRNALRMNQSTLAAKAGVDQGQLSRAERGLCRVSMTSLRKLEKIVGTLPLRDEVAAS